MSSVKELTADTLGHTLITMSKHMDYRVLIILHDQETSNDLTSSLSYGLRNNWTFGFWGELINPHRKILSIRPIENVLLGGSIEVGLIDDYNYDLYNEVLVEEGWLDSVLYRQQQNEFKGKELYQRFLDEFFGTKY